MFKRSASSARLRAGGLRAGLFALALVAPGLAAADPLAPLLMDPAYAERAEVARLPGCQVVIAGLTDTRRAPETIGVVPGFRSISAPADRDAWFRSVIETGLRERGFTPSFAPAEPPAPPAADGAVATEIAATETAAPAPGPAVLTIRVGLHSVWLSTLGMNKTGSVVLHMSAARGDQSHEDYYRGEYLSPNWAGGRGEFNEHLDRTFAEALNSMAADLAPMCGGAP
ncbi:hypothetical protein [Terricaulis sp.]|uniref:hypothetical protein n=1 Tax=Terricaulis sp. TaxID=2768686 RepID=UPI00378460E8